jgi:hypothetical protein
MSRKKKIPGFCQKTGYFLVRYTGNSGLKGPCNSLWRDAGFTENILPE